LRRYAEVDALSGTIARRATGRRVDGGIRKAVTLEDLFRARSRRGWRLRWRGERSCNALVSHERGAMPTIANRQTPAEP
jgi:hypothetical protein